MEELFEFNPRSHGEFVEEQRCPCPDSELHATKFYEVECDFMDRKAKQFLNVARITLCVASVGLTLCSPVLGLLLAASTILAHAPNWGQDLTHSCLEVLYKCRLCEHEVHVTYEFMNPGETSNDCGRYSKTYKPTKLHGITTTAFEDIERVFHGMWTQYNLLYKNCKHWTNDLIGRLRSDALPPPLTAEDDDVNE
uniref:PPPDE domain-containing protein n=1 Tax=Globodera rostochiensis TaxID=31243 RepID=A0A914HNV6_GLORO